MTSSTPPTPAEIDDFIALSGVLTGIDPGLLKPAFPVNDVYLQIMNAARSDGMVYKLLIDVFKIDRATHMSDAAIVEKILSDTGPRGLLARSIILAWYSGTWHRPAGLYKGGISYVLSADAYTAGYMWQVAQAHPMGSADYPFGYWNSPPPPLSDFITVTS
ncbi:hypothetical protein [Niveispirillum fermenti]|uniref:hypothetical protein n=1 Tax=Niveispirillum fermenti TaxID=1233113 RepID=UPI003A852CE0